MKKLFSVENLGSYDVVICGGGASGIAAAYSAYEQGAKVLIIEKAGIIGGNLTIGHIGPMMGEYEKNTFADRLTKLLAEDKFLSVYDFEKAKIKLTELLDKENITIFLNSSVTEVIKKGKKIKQVIFSTQNGLKSVSGKIFIDATGDGVLSYLAKEEIMYGREDGLVQPLSIMFTICGVDEKQNLICMHEEMDTPLKKGNYLQLCKDACASGELPKNVNIVRLYAGLNKGERLVNATQENGLNPLSLTDYTKAQVELRKQILQVFNFLKNNIEGFENIKIKDSSDIVGVRESRRVKGEYLITSQELMAGKKHKDVIVHNASFALDIHNPDGAGQAESEGLPPQPPKYDIPYRATLPLKTDNLLLSGRIISGTHRAHASYRVMNIATCIGEAVGISAGLCVKENTLPKQLKVEKIQKVLLDKNINLFN